MNCRNFIPEFPEGLQKDFKYLMSTMGRSLPIQETLNTVAVGAVASLISLAVRKLRVVSRFRESENKLVIVALTIFSGIILGALMVYTGLMEQLCYLTEPLVNNALSKGLTCIVGAAMPHAGCIKKALINSVETTVSGCSRGAKACAETLKTAKTKITGQIQECMAKKENQAEEPSPIRKSPRTTRYNSCSKNE